MNSPTSHIGFDRFIHLDWVVCALKIRAGSCELDDIIELLDSAGLGKEALAKTRTKLNGLGLRPQRDMVDFVDRGRELVQDYSRADSVVAFAWGVAIATYPFFGRIAEIVGRLTSLHGDCSSLEIHRRMGEVYGDREVTKRATQAVLQTQAGWGTVERVQKGKRVIRLAPLMLDSDQRTAWLIESALRYSGKPVSVSSLHSLPVLFPFTLSPSLAYLVSNSANLELRSEGPSHQIVSLRRTT